MKTLYQSVRSLSDVILLVLLYSLINGCQKKHNDPATTNTKPIANFSFNILNNGILPCTVNFSDSSKFADTYKWDFDNCSTSSIAKPVNSYSAAKIYNVKLVVSNAFGKDSITKQVTILLNKPKANFNFTIVDNGNLPTTVNFTNATIGGNTYKWYFDDGNTSILSDPVEKYILSKSYNVKLVASNASGKDSITKTVSITINPLKYSVRIFLITPTDRQFNQKYYDAIKMCALNLQSWYKGQMGGKTFTLNNPIIDTLKGKHSYNWYNQYNDTYSGTDPRFYGFNNALYEIKQVIGTLDLHLYMNAIYVAAPGGGAGSPGLCALGDQDLDGLLGINTTNLNINRWIGGSGHEWGHAFGLAHPENQDPVALMWTGLYNYPNCVLLQEDKDILNTSPFFK